MSYSKSNKYQSFNKHNNHTDKMVNPNNQKNTYSNKNEKVNLIEVFRWSPQVARFRIAKQPDNLKSHIKVVLGNDIDYDNLTVKKISHNTFQVQLNK